MNVTLNIYKNNPKEQLTQRQKLLFNNQVVNKISFSNSKYTFKLNVPKKKATIVSIFKKRYFRFCNALYIKSFTKKYEALDNENDKLLLISKELINARIYKLTITHVVKDENVAKKLELLFNKAKETKVLEIIHTYGENNDHAHKRSKFQLLASIVQEGFNNPHFDSKNVGFKDDLEMFEFCKGMYKETDKNPQERSLYSEFILPEEIHLRVEKIAKTGDLSEVEKLLQSARELIPSLFTQGLIDLYTQLSGLCKSLEPKRNDTKFKKAYDDIKNFYQTQINRKKFLRDEYDEEVWGLKPNDGAKDDRYRKTLGIHEDAELTEEYIKKAYRKKVMIHHPDQGGNAEQFRLIHEAYEVLMYELTNKTI